MAELNNKKNVNDALRPGARCRVTWDRDNWDESGEGGVSMWLVDKVLRQETEQSQLEHIQSWSTSWALTRLGQSGQEFLIVIVQFV